MTRRLALRAADAGAALLATGAGWLAGVGWQLRQAALWPAPRYALLAAVGVLLLTVLLLICRRTSTSHVGTSGTAGRRWRGEAIALLLTAAAGLGFGATGLHAVARLADRLPDALEGVDLRVTGVVASLPQHAADGLRFQFAAENAALPDGRLVSLPPRLALGWYTGFHEDAALTPPQRELSAGQRWQLTLRLRQPHGNLNPHGFDGELRTFEQGVRAVGYVRDAPPPRLLDRDAGFVVTRLRQRIRDAIEARIADRRIAGVLAALAVGDQSAISREDWALFRDTGISHLVAISGLHVAMFAWLAGVMVTALWRRSRRAMQCLPAPTAGALGGLAAALGYAVLAGFGVPAQRTVWMLLVVGGLRLAGLRWPWPLTLLAAAVVVTALDPWALLQPGFWLSFTAVGLLMTGGPVGGGTLRPARPPDAATGWQHRLFAPLRALPARLGAGVRTQLVATLGLAPLTLVFFQQLSAVGLPANLVAIPVVTLLVTPLALLGVLIWPLWLAAAWALAELSVLLQWLAGWPGAVWFAPVAPWWAQAAGLAAAVLLVAPLPWRVRALALPLLLPLLLPPLARPADGQFDLLAVDVGQGTAVLVRTRYHLLVYDSGPQYTRDSDAGQRVLLPLLRARGDTRIDRLLLSHRDTDHTGGAAALLRALPVQAVSSSIEDGHPLRADIARRRIAHSRCEAGQRWRWDGVDFAVLAPPAAAYDVPQRGANALSCVLQVRAARPPHDSRGTPGTAAVAAGTAAAAGFVATARIAGAPGAGVALLTGDIERAQELALTAAAAESAEAAAVLRSDLLVVPHHGSKTSSTPSFIDAVAPRVAVFQSGYRNRFGHPAPEVLARYVERGIRVVTSPACGAWHWHSAPDTADSDTADCERERVRRYWHHPAQLDGDF